MKNREGEEWMVDIILEIVVWMVFLNGISECNLSDEESMFLSHDFTSSKLIIEIMVFKACATMTTMTSKYSMMS